MKSILLLRWLKLRDDIKLVGLMTIITLIMIGVFSSFDYSVQDLKFAVIDEDQSSLSKQFTEDLKEADGYSVEVMDLQGAKKAVKNEDVSIAFYLKEGFMEHVLEGEVEVVRFVVKENIDNRSAIGLFESRLKRLKSDQILIREIKAYITRQDLRVQDIESRIQNKINDKRMTITPVVTKVDSYKEEEPYNQIKQSVIGFSLFFAMFTIIFGISDILMEKELHTWQRQLITPISQLSILTGHMSFVFLLGFLQVSSMFLVSKYLFKVTWVGNMGYLLIVIAVFVFCVASLGMFLSNFVKTMGQLSALAPIIITGTAMIGGCFWPLEIVTSKVLLFLSLLTPQRWAIQGIRGIIVYNENLKDVLLPIGVLVSMGIVYLLLGAYFLKKKPV